MHWRNTHPTKDGSVADMCQEQVDMTIMAAGSIFVETANCRRSSPLAALGRLGLGAVAKPDAIAAGEGHSLLRAEILAGRAMRKAHPKEGDCGLNSYP